MFMYANLRISNQKAFYDIIKTKNRPEGDFLKHIFKLLIQVSIG